MSHIFNVAVLRRGPIVENLRVRRLAVGFASRRQG